MASHPVPLPDTLQSNLQVTLVAIIKTVLLWQCVQLVLSPAPDSFQVTERKKKGRRMWDDAKEGHDYSYSFTKEASAAVSFLLGPF